MPFTERNLLDAGFNGTVGYRDEVALRLLCAFNGVDWQKAPPGWWSHPNKSSKAAWGRVAAEAQLLSTGWQTIETRPDDGTWFLACGPSGALSVIRPIGPGSDMYEAACAQCALPENDQPTHWLRIPTKP